MNEANSIQYETTISHLELEITMIQERLRVLCKRINDRMAQVEKDIDGNRLAVDQLGVLQIYAVEYDLLCAKLVAKRESIKMLDKLYFISD